MKGKLLTIFGYFQKILLDCIVGHIPCWALRKPLYRLAGIKIGKGSRILMGAKIQGPHGISIGEHSYINSGCHLDGRGGLLIGDNVNISNYTVIVTASHDMKSSSFQYREGKVVIEDYCWIGTRAIVLDRSTLAECSVLSAGSVYKGQGKPRGVYAGVPAQYVRDRGLEGKYDVDWRPYFI